MLNIKRALNDKRLLRALTGMNLQPFFLFCLVRRTHVLQKQYENIDLPHGKPKGGELSSAQKEENRLLSSTSVVCENAFAGVKHYGGVSQVYRNRQVDFDDHLMLTCAGLWNFYLRAA